MVGKTEFTAPLHVLHQCPTSQPKHAVLQHLQTLHFGGTRLLSEITLKSAHLHSDTQSLCATLTLSVSLLQIHTRLHSAEEYQTGQYLFFLSYFAVCMKSHQHQNHRKARGRCCLGRRCMDGHPFVELGGRTHRPTPAARQTQSQIIHNWNIH